MVIKIKELVIIINSLLSQAVHQQNSQTFTYLIVCVVAEMVGMSLIVSLAAQHSN